MADFAVDHAFKLANFWLRKLTKKFLIFSLDCHPGQQKIMGESEERLYKLGDACLLDPTNKCLWRNGKPLTIAPHDFDVLWFFVENRGRLVTRKDLVGKFWPNQAVTFYQNQSLNQAIHRLREHLGGSAKDRSYIETVPKRGYKLIASVDELKSKNGYQAPPTPAEDISVPVLITVVLFIGVVVTVVLSIFAIPGPWGKTGAGIAQLALIFVMFVYSLGRPKNFCSIEPELEEKLRKESGYSSSNESEWETAKDIADIAFNDHRRCWLGLLFSWCLFYFVLALIWPTKSEQQPNYPMLRITATLINNLNSMFIALCYIILKRPTVIKQGRWYVSNVPWSMSLVIVAAPTMIEAILVRVFEQVSPHVLSGVDLLSGISAGIVLFLYVGCLRNKILGLSPWLLIPLYSYAALQPLYAVFHERLPAMFDEQTSRVMDVSILNAVLILKCLLYLCVTWLFQSLRLLSYFVPRADATERLSDKPFPGRR